MLTGFGVTVYQLQRVNRLREIDSALETRVTALSNAVREAYRDGPGGAGPPGNPPPRHPPPEGRGPGGRPPGDGPPRDGPPPDHGHPPRRDFGPQRHAPGGPPPPRQPPERPPAEVPLSSATTALFGPGAGGYYFTIWYRDGRVLNHSDNAPVDIPPPLPSERDTLAHFRTRQQFREAVHCSGFGDCSMAGLSIQSDLKAARTFAWTLFAAGAAVLALGFGIGWWLIGRAIRPVEQIGAAATRIAAGNLSERIAVADPDDELGRLAAVLNSTFARLESAFARQRQFTSDAAHELRTPLAILISEAQTTLARERTAAEYRETVEGSLETAQQMRRITETLLELARFDAGDRSASRDRVDLAGVVSRCVERLKPLAASEGVTIMTHLSPAFASILPERLELVVANLVLNAIHYNRPGGEVRLSIYSENASAILTVSDTGIGIPAEDIAHIFDRFYRVDKARSLANGHAGLGLAISKTIIEAERGSIEVLSTPQKGTTFTVRFPNSGCRS